MILMIMLKMQLIMVQLLVLLILWALCVDLKVLLELIKI
jgi:hypothetical protein